MQIPEMRQLLPEHMRSSAKDTETKEIMINEAKVFLTELLGTKGRRNDVNRNAHRGPMPRISALQATGVGANLTLGSPCRACVLHWRLGYSLRAHGPIANPANDTRR